MKFDDCYMVSESGCWLWTRSVDRKGYGVFARHTKAHRLAYERRYGPIMFGFERGKQTHVRCDVPACVNPDHLFLGAHRHNMQDMVEKQRHARGDRLSVAIKKGAARGDLNGVHTHPNSIVRGDRQPLAKLNSAKVAEIRSRIADGETQRSLARAFGVSQSVISDIKRGVKWKVIVDGQRGSEGG